MSRIKTVLDFALGAVVLLTQAERAQSNYPNRPVCIIAPYPPAGMALQ